MAKNRNNFYTRILKKLDDEIDDAHDPYLTNNDPGDPVMLGHLEAIRHYMQARDKQNGFFACQVIIENWFEKERASF